MTAEPNEPSTRELSARVDLDELFRDAPVLTSPHDLAAQRYSPTTPSSRSSWFPTVLIVSATLLD